MYFFYFFYLISEPNVIVYSKVNKCKIINNSKKLINIQFIIIVININHSLKLVIYIYFHRFFVLRVIKLYILLDSNSNFKNNPLSYLMCLTESAFPCYSILAGNSNALLLYVFTVISFVIIIINVCPLKTQIKRSIQICSGSNIGFKIFSPLFILLSL